MHLYRSSRSTNGCIYTDLADLQMNVFIQITRFLSGCMYIVLYSSINGNEGAKGTMILYLIKSDFDLIKSIGFSIYPKKQLGSHNQPNLDVGYTVMTRITKIGVWTQGNNTLRK